MILLGNHTQSPQTEGFLVHLGKCLNISERNSSHKEAEQRLREGCQQWRAHLRGATAADPSAVPAAEQQSLELRNVLLSQLLRPGVSRE